MKKINYIIAIILLITVCSFTGCTRESPPEEKTIGYYYMPALEGMMEDEAKVKLIDMGLNNYVVEYEESSTVEEGRVIRQSIPEHSVVGTDYEIKMWVSRKNK